MVKNAVLVAMAALLCAFSGAAVAAAPTPKSDPKPKNETSAEFIRKVLDSKTNLEFNGTNVPTILAQLTEDHRVSFVLDKAAIQMMGVEANELVINDIKLKDVKLRTGLRSMLSQYNLTPVIVDDSVLITTEDQAIYKQLKQRISIDLNEVPLNKAVKEIAHNYAVNVVMDPRANKNKAAETAITLNVDDVPLEAVVRLMCEMSGLKPARVGNVIFITTEDRADKLKDADGSLVPSTGLPAVPGVPGGALGPGGVLPGGAIPAPPGAAPLAPPGAAPAQPPIAN